MMRKAIFLLILRPIIQRDYRLRAKGVRPDRWHWADMLAVKWGFFVDAA
jgi:hypothetical protein